MAETQENQGGTLTAQILKSKSGEFDLESIHTLNLNKLELTDLGCLGECSSLERLDLSYNDITRLYALAGLTNLTDLNLSANRISSLEGLQSLDNLESIQLMGNLIGSIETLRCLSTLEKLTDIRLKDDLRELSNPVCLRQTYKKDVQTILPNLKTLDGERLVGKGSELFNMCSELDSIIEVRDRQTDTGPLSSRVHGWVPPDYWTKTPQLEFDKSNLHDAQQQLEDLLAECKRVTSAADEKLKSIAHEQYSHSDVS